MDNSLTDTLVNDYSINKEEAIAVLGALSFSDYLALSSAVSSGDEHAVNDILGVFGLLEDAPIGVGKQGTVGSSSLPQQGGNNNLSTDDDMDDFSVNSLGPGDTMTLGANDNEEELEISNVRQVGDELVLNTNSGSEIKLSQDEMAAMQQADDADLERLKQLSGVKEESTVGAVTSGAIAGVTMPFSDMGADQHGMLKRKKVEKEKKRKKKMDRNVMLKR